MVLVKKGKVIDMKLVYLDWAGVHGEATYPLLMNTQDIRWPVGADPLQVMLQCHDALLLQMQMEPSASSDWEQLLA